MDVRTRPELATLVVTRRNAGKLSVSAHQMQHITKSHQGAIVCREAFFHSISCLHTEMCQSKVVFRSATRVRSAGEVRPVLE